MSFGICSGFPLNDIHMGDMGRASGMMGLRRGVWPMAPVNSQSHFACHHEEASWTWGSHLPLFVLATVHF